MRLKHLSVLTLSLCACVSLPTLANGETVQSPEASLSSMLQEKLNTPVSVKQVLSSNLYSVAFGDKVFFTDESGSVLINGDILSLSENLVISNVIKEEYEALRRKQSVINDSKLSSLSIFLEESSSTIPRTTTRSDAEKLKAMPAELDDQIEGQRVSIKNKISTLSPYKNDLNDNHTQPPAKTAVSTPERIISPEERQCRDMIGEPNSLQGLYDTFRTMDEPTAKLCGQVLAGSIVPRQPDDEFLVYPAANERATITMVSDYTCGYCQKDHKQIKALNDQGITVRLAPFGRGDYREIKKLPDGSLTYTDKLTLLGHNYTALQCGDESVSGAVGFDELMSNPRKFSTTLLSPSAEFDKTCEASVLRNKLLLDLYTTRGTPLYIFDDGSTARSSLSVSELIAKAI